MKILSWEHPRFGTPWGALIICAILCIGFGFLDFDKLISLNNLLYSSLLFLDYVYLIRLRYTKPDLYRPYKIGSNFKTILLCLPPMALCLYIIVCGAVYYPIQFGIFCGVWVVSMAIYGVLRWKRGNVTLIEKEGGSDDETIN